MTEKPRDEFPPDVIAARMLRALRRAGSMPHTTQKPPKPKRGRPRKRVLKPRRSSGG
jgi:hypothetical protein